MADGGVAGRHMMEAVLHDGCRAAGDIVHRAARDQPHHEFDALAAGFAHIVDVGQLGEFCRLGNQPVQEAVVPVLVDEPGTAWCPGGLTAQNALSRAPSKTCFEASRMPPTASLAMSYV